MIAIHPLITALIRLLGLYYAVGAVDNVIGYFYMMSIQISSLPSTEEYQLPNPWFLLLSTFGIYLFLAIAIFFLAPWLARVFVGSKPSESADVPLSETVVCCTGILVISWAFVRLIETAGVVVDAAERNDGRYSLSNVNMVKLFMTAMLMGGGIMIISKVHRIGHWIRRKHLAANKTS